MKKSSFALPVVALALVALVAANSQAVSVTVAAPVPVTDAIGGHTGELWRYDVSLHSDTGTNLTALDIMFAGQMFQAQTAGFSGANPTPKRSDAEQLGPDGAAVDSHLIPSLIEPGPPVDPPSEGLVAGLSSPGGTGFADSLRSSQVALAAPAQMASVLVAQIVLEPGTFVLLNGTVAVAGNSDPQTLPETVVGVPEPASMMLLGCGMVGLVVCRRRLK